MSLIAQLGVMASSKNALPASNFTVVHYIGNGSTQSITGVDFQPDLVIIVTPGQGSFIFDTAQGVGKFLVLGSSAAQIIDANSLTSFDSDGFSLGNSTYVNKSGEENFAYCFKKAAGFLDIVSYTGNATNRNLAHGLGVLPAMYFARRLTSGADAAWYHKSANRGVTPEQYYFTDSSSVNVTSSATMWNNTAPTTTDIRLGTNSQVNQSSAQFIAYIFGQQTGNSDFGYYIGNNNATGPVVPTLTNTDVVFMKGVSSGNPLINYSHAVWGLDQATINPKKKGQLIGGAGSNPSSDFDINAGSFQPKSTYIYANAAHDYLYFSFRARKRHFAVNFSPSSSSFTIPNFSGMPANLDIEAWGPGGNGGNGDASFAGAGAGSGAYAKKSKTVAAGDVIPFTVGTPGTDTTCDGMTAGKGSNGASASGSNGIGGVGGTATGGVTNTNGNTGTNGNGTTGGDGAAAPKGGSARAGGTGVGGSGNAPGGGAAGGGNGSDAGGPGANGRIRLSC